MIYLDSAATTLKKPPAVARSAAWAVGHLATPGRGGHPPAANAAGLSFRCRELAARLFGVADPERVIFTFNATHALNIAIRSLVPPGGRVLLSGWEHNAVTRPLADLDVKVRMASGPLFRPETALAAFEASIEPGISAVICTHVSNVFGFILPHLLMVLIYRSNGDLVHFTDVALSVPYAFLYGAVCCAAILLLCFPLYLIAKGNCKAFDERARKLAFWNLRHGCLLGLSFLVLSFGIITGCVVLTVTFSIHAAVTTIAAILVEGALLAGTIWLYIRARRQ